MEKDDIRNRIEKQRSKLDKMLDSEDYNEVEILKLSQEIDELINSYMKQQN